MNHSVKHSWFIAIGLCLLVICLYGQSLQFQFINFDDEFYVVLNDHVNKGFSWSGVYWAFTSFEMSNWHPVTWLSHMLDVELYGLNAGGHHGTNVVLHALNTVLILYFLRLAGMTIPLAGTMAALFALHPMHVESVVWIAERKDVLSTFFLLLSLIAHVHYVRHGSALNYVMVLIFAALGLMSKAMLVTLPFILLLLDYYPLKRLDLPDAGRIDVGKSLARLRHLLVEKVPLFLLAFATMALAYLSQSTSGTMTFGAEFSAPEKLANALVAYSHYIVKAIVPGPLAIFYPHPVEWPVVDVLLGTVMLVTVSLSVLWNFRARPYLFVGWFWFLGTLVPVIGLVQIGAQYMADRYTYIPYIGLFLAFLPLLMELFDKAPRGRLYYTASLSLLLTFYAVTALQYAGHWRNSVTVLTHSLLVTDPSYERLIGVDTDLHHREFVLLGSLWTPYFSLGTALAAQGRFPEALAHLETATQLGPQIATAHNNKGLVLAALGRKQEALDAFRAAIEAQPDDDIARMNFTHLQEEWKITP